MSPLLRNEAAWGWKGEASGVVNSFNPGACRGPPPRRPPERGEMKRKPVAKPGRLDAFFSFVAAGGPHGVVPAQWNRAV